MSDFKVRPPRGGWDLVKERVDLVQLIAEYVPLKRAGRGYSGLCPFHPEKTPSFHVDPERRVFRWFGCGAEGDCFSSLEKTSGLEPAEALKTLAERIERGDFEPIQPLVSCDWCRELVPHDDEHYLYDGHTVWGMTHRACAESWYRSAEVGGKLLGSLNGEAP